jgi:hypothetical protein
MYDEKKDESNVMINCWKLKGFIDNLFNTIKKIIKKQIN